MIIKNWQLLTLANGEDQRLVNRNFSKVNYLN